MSAEGKAFQKQWTVHASKDKPVVCEQSYLAGGGGHLWFALLHILSPFCVQ